MTAGVPGPEPAPRTIGGRRLGGTEGNRVLTSAAAAVLTVLLAAEGVTILNLDWLRRPHMFVGMLLIPPVLVKLGSTGYRFARYYAGTRPYREKGPPLLPLRLFAPVLVAATLGVFGTGVALLIAGHRSGSLLMLHKVSFVVWGVAFAAHFLAHLPTMVRSRSDWTAAGRRRLPGSDMRLAVVVLSVLAGAALALATLAAIDGWHARSY